MIRSKPSPFKPGAPKPLMRRKSQQGLTLVEWMVSITLGMFLLIGLTALIGQQSSTRRSVDNAGRLIENGRYATELIAKDLQLAGYFGELSTIPAATAAIPVACTDLDTAEIQAAMPVHVQGINAPTADEVSCLPNYKAGTDILVIRRADVTEVATGAAQANELYLQVGINTAGLEFSYVLDVAGSAGFVLTKKDQVTTAPLRRFLTHIYYVAQCSVPDGPGSTCTATSDGGFPIPTLYRAELEYLTGAPGARGFRSYSLVEGIENVQYDFGLDFVRPSTPTDVVDGSPEEFTAGATYTPVSGGAAVALEGTDWANVMAVKVHVLARSVEREIGHVDGKTFNMGLSGSVTPGAVAGQEPYTRHVFSRLVRLVNPSSRRANA